MLRTLLASVLLCFLAIGVPGKAAWAGEGIVRDLPPGLQIPISAERGPAFDVDSATQSYLELLSPQQRELSDQYFEGGYWIQLWELLWTVGACGLLIVTGTSNRINEFFQRLNQRRWISTPVGRSRHDDDRLLGQSRGQHVHAKSCCGV